MSNREKVLSWIEGLTKDDWRLFHSESEVSEIAKAVLALLKEQQQQIWELQDQVEYLTDKLKEQEPVKRKISPEGVRCGKCDRRLRYDSKFCDKCGKAVKLE